MKYKKRSLVTGGAGFIGSNLVDELVRQNHEVIVLDNFSTGRLSNLKHHNKSHVKVFKIDISKNSKLDKYFKKIDHVYHLAALADIIPSIENPGKYYKTNVVGTFNILQASVKSKVKKFIYAGSASCYGFPEKFPTDEKAKIKPQYPYAFTKWQGEEMVMHWAKLFNFPAVSMRFFNIYGPRSRTSGAYGAVFGVFLAQKLANFPLTIVGDGNQTRDFLYIDDLVKILIKVAHSNKSGKIYNVGASKEVTVNKIANLIGGKKVFVPKRPGEPDRSKADIKKLKKDFNWKPRIDIKEGVKNLLTSIKDWKKAPVWTPKKINKATKIWFHLIKKNTTKDK